jgi:hypothetical protein
MFSCNVERYSLQNVFAAIIEAKRPPGDRKPRGWKPQTPEEKHLFDALRSDLVPRFSKEFADRRYAEEREVRRLRAVQQNSERAGLMCGLFCLAPVVPLGYQYLHVTGYTLDLARTPDAILPLHFVIKKINALEPHYEVPETKEALHCNITHGERRTLKQRAAYVLALHWTNVNPSSQRLAMEMLWPGCVMARLKRKAAPVADEKGGAKQARVEDVQ